ncbi:MAG TPA: ribbon-helix-helix protein, CopG family [Acetobacteraceae bacterium]
MSDDTENMVLRTLYLPRDLDQALKVAANRSARSKGDVIRELILAGLKKKRAEPGSYFAEPLSGKKPVRPSAPTRSLVTKAKRRVVQARKKVAAA